MKSEKLRKMLDKYGKEMDFEVKIFDNPAFDDSIIGVSMNGEIVYDYESMIMEFAQELIQDGFSKNMDEAIMDALDFVNYDTMRAIPYMGENKPIIVTHIKDIKERY